ncbi:MAG: transglutaminase-like domain-containing protein [Vicinamibacterales bacterium]
MPLLRPLPRAVTRPVSLLVVVAWAGVMGLLVHRSYIASASVNLATDLARYGSGATWRGIYYRGDKVGFTVSETVPTEAGYELHEDGRLQMNLLGQTSPAALRTTARVDREFALQSFEFSLDPGTGAVKVSGVVQRSDAGRPRLALAITTPGAPPRTEVRDLDQPPMLSLNLSRLLASGRLVEGTTHRLTLFDPATLRNAPVTVTVGNREIVRSDDRTVPAFRVSMEFQGLETVSWVTDTGEVVREESPLGLISVVEDAARAQNFVVSGRMRSDLLTAAAIVPEMRYRIDEPRDVTGLTLALSGVDLSQYDLDGVGQSLAGRVLTITDPRDAVAGAEPVSIDAYLAPEPFIESDAPEVRQEVEAALAGAPADARARAERLVRYVNALLEKKPTVSLPSAREVLRTRVGDCNEHTALYVAMARAAGIPARINVGLVFMRGGFYYHAWPEVFIADLPPEGGSHSARGYWLPVDPTLNEFPANTTHVRLLRGGLERQADILPLIGRLNIAVTDVQFAPGTVPVLVGGEQP